MSSNFENSFFMRKVPRLRLRRSSDQLRVQKVVALFKNIGEFFLSLVNDGEQTFRLFDDELFENRIIYGAKPDWCPIKLIPDKKDVKNAENMTSLGWIEGWNACLDEIEWR